MKAPKLTIGMPIFNGGRYLRESLASILGQDFDNFEIVISNNGSTDDTELICLEFASLDRRIRYFRNDSNIGAAENYNRVFRLSKGEFFKWATHDDICLPGFFRRAIEIFDSAPSSVVLVYPQAKFIDSHGGFVSNDTDSLETRHPKPYRRLSHILHNVNMANAIFGIIRSDALKETRLIDKFIASDYVLLAELAMLGEFWEVREPLFLRRIHEDGSQYANKTNKDVLSWFDPSQKLQFNVLHEWFPKATLRSRLVIEWWRSVFQIKMSRQQKLLCWFSVPIVYGYSRLRCFAGAMKRRLSQTANG